MFASIRERVGRRKTAAVAAVTAILVAVPVGIALAHPGFPVTDVELSARDVWVTNGTDLLLGRLNKPIEELNAAVATVSNDIDVLQDGDTVFLHDRSGSTLERADPAFATLIERADVPRAAQISLRADRLSVLDPASGELWVTDVSTGLTFSASEEKPRLKLGADAQAVVREDGSVVALSREKNTLFTVPRDGSDPISREVSASDDAVLSAVGEHTVILDREHNTLLIDERDPVTLPEPALQLQQPGQAAEDAVVATGDGLIRVPLRGGDAEVISAEIRRAATEPSEVSRPVNVDGCAHGAWPGAARYLGACAEKKSEIAEIAPIAPGAPLTFRVNRSIVALNNTLTGDVWLVTSDMRLVRNWDEVTPPDDEGEEEGEEKSARQTFEDTIAERTEVNRPPLARDDDMGVRPGRSTVLPLLDNDNDPDGDVLTITNLTPVPADQGTLQLVDGGRAVQYTPREDQTSGAPSFRYTVSDGRPGGVAEATARLRIVPPESNEPPQAQRAGSTSVEAGQTVTYNALLDWRDPDGDDIYLVQAASDAGDEVRFTPDGFITVRHTSAQIGPREIVFVVSDGTATNAGSFRLDVTAAGELRPVGVPDFATGFLGRTIEISPLANDISPTGSPLTLVSAEAETGGISLTANTDHGTIQATSGAVGSYYVRYTLASEGTTSVGMIRIDVQDNPATDEGPIAVRDTAYLRPFEPLELPVLTNDVSPTGAVLAIRDLEIPDAARGLSIEVLNSSILRITASSAITEQLQFGYVVSDGVQEARTTVTVVPVPALVKHQAPIAMDDTQTVRVGDIATVHVLDNDRHPDNAPMALEAELAEEPSAGLAFVSKDTVRFQAPREPGTYSAVYTVTDQFEQKAVARVTFAVVAEDRKNNRAAAPQPLTARAFAGSVVRVNVPLDGIDPDGDSVVFDSIGSAPELGAVTSTTSTWFEYESSPDSAGTDTFEYRVRDSYGEVSTGTISIGVIPRPSQALPPTAVDDTVQVKPGKIASVPVLENDTDPNGYTVSLSEVLADIPEGLVATVRGARIDIEAPNEETEFSLRYEISNGEGGTDTAFLHVSVTEDARVLSPTAEDHVREATELVGKREVIVDIRADAGNPNGPVEALTASMEGPGAEHAVLAENGEVTVTLGDKRQAVAYRLSDEETGKSAQAFIVVPPFSDGLPPRIRPDLAEQIVPMNETRTWTLADVAMSPTGRDLRIIDAASAVSTRSDGSPNVLDDRTLSFTPARDYRGPASITFMASDGQSTGEALLVLPITVGDPERKDEPPSFTPPTLTLEAGEAAVTADLRQNTSHPNPALVDEVRFSAPTGTTNGVTVALNGSTLTASAPFGTPSGTAVSVPVTLSFEKFTVEGTVHIQVVSSTRPLPRAMDDVEAEGRKGRTVRMPVLANDYNPFPGEKLTLLSATLESGDASVAVSGDELVVTPGSAKSQQIVVVYTIGDVTTDEARRSSGRATVTVTSEPDRPAAPTLNASDGSISVTVNASPSSNGAAITTYTVRRNDGETKTVTSPGRAVAFPGTNGTAYSFTVTATNRVGPSEPSTAASATSYGVPGAPKPTLRGSGPYAPGTATLSWSAPSQTGGKITEYRWRFSSGASGSGTSLTAQAGNLGVGSYTGWVRACSPAGCGPEAQAGPVSFATKPPPPPAVSAITPFATGTYYKPNGEPVHNASRIQFSVTNWPTGPINVVPQYCNNGTWHGVINGSYDFTVNQPNQTIQTEAWLQHGTFSNCGVRVVINGTAYGATSW